MKDLNCKSMFKGSGRVVSFTNIVGSRIDIFITIPLLINFWPKMRNEPNQNIGVSRLIKKLMKYETRNCLRPYNNLSLFRIKGGGEPLPVSSL